MEFRILGPLEAGSDTGPVDLAGGKQKALLALLLLHADRVVPVARLVDDLWGEEVPASAPKMVQISVSQLRKQLPQGLIETRSPGYRLALEGHSLDLRAFESLHARGRAELAGGRPQEAAATLRRALGLWRGAPLAEFEEPFARLEETRLDEQHLVCLEECIDAELALGLHAELVAEVDALVRRHPLRERLRGQLMLALYRCGRHAEALETFQRFKRMLRDELGIAAPQRLKELERLILRQDGSLDLDPGERTTRPDLPPAAFPGERDAARGSIEFGILGPLEVRAAGRAVPLGGSRRRAVLALLLLEANRVVPVDRLVDGVWGDDPPTSAQASLQNHLVRLRRELGDRLVTRAPGYVLEVEPGELDLDRFQRLVEEAAGADPAVAAERLREALALWRGTPLADLAGEPAGRAAAHLDELRLAALEDRIDADLQLGRHGELVPELEALVVRAPYRERLRRQLIVALYRSGRQADAQAAYADARRILIEELGTEPGRELQELQRAVLRQDRSLDAPSAAAPSDPQLAESRKTVTVLVADITPAEAPDDPEARRATMLERRRAVTLELDRHGAAVAALGGRMLGVFGVPSARDDDALRAVTAAVALRSADLAGRVGVSTGEVVTGDPVVSGAPVDEAARLLELARPGEVLGAARTWRVVRHAVTASPRDGGWTIDAVDPDAVPLARRLETPLVGRDRELREIADAFSRAAAEGRPHLVTVFGAPGVGKTRLAVETAERLRGLASSAVGRCRAAAQETTYAPLREVLSALGGEHVAAWIRQRLAADDSVRLAEQLAAAVEVAAGPAHIEDTALAARRLLAGLARERPLLLVLEDVHWAAPAFLDLVESLVELGQAPLLVLCLARPDLLDIRPHWGGGRLSSSAVLLDALPPAEAEALLDRLSPTEPLDTGARERILAVAEGNPLFIEQLLAAAIEDDPAALPDSIQTLIEARLDRLDELDRAVVEAAAICGASFATEDVAALVEGDVAATLVALVRRELIRPGEAGDPGRDGWSFRHSLIRDVAYGSVPKWRRAELHQRLAERAAGRGGDGDATAGFHLELAVRARQETGATGPAVDELAARAAEHLHRAGSAALDRDDMAAAAALLRRADGLLPHGAPERARVLPKLGAALSWIGDPDAVRALAEAHAVAVELGDARLAAHARVTTLALMWADADVPPEQMLRELEDAVPILEQAGDHEALALAEVARFHALDRGRLPDPEARLPIALDHARRAGAAQIEHHVMGWICITLPRGTVPVDAAIARVEEIVETSSASAYVHASALGAIGLLRAAKGEFEEARALVAEDRRMLEELGLRQAAAAHSIAIGEVEQLAGDDAAAERVFRSGFDAVLALGDEISGANLAWRLGLLLARQGRIDEAERFARVAERTRAPALWIDVWQRIVAALVEANRGASGHAHELVAGARELMAAAQESGMHADALLECAEVMRLSGRSDESAALVAEAAGIAERLGYVVALERAREAQRAPTA